MANILNIQNPWRNLLTQMASFRRIVFHVETGARMSGRRTVVHEYPKKNIPYAEDMGMQAWRFHFSGYLIYRPTNPNYDYVSQRDRLHRALEEDGPGELVHPVFSPRASITVMCERYSMIENRQRGGFTEFEMQFVQSGQPGNLALLVNPAAAVTSAAEGSEQAASANLTRVGGIGHA